MQASVANLPVVYNAGQVKGYPQTPDIRGAQTYIIPVVYNAHEAGQVKGYPQTPDIRGARAPENLISERSEPTNGAIFLYTCIRYWRAKRAYLVVRMARFFYYVIYI